jgi:outer membrane protein TolC
MARSHVARALGMLPIPMRRSHLFIAILTLTAAGRPALADSLPEALVRTYNSNPTLTAQRSELRSSDEGVGIAKSQTRPQLSGTVGFDQDLTRSGGGSYTNYLGTADDRTAVEANTLALEGTKAEQSVGTRNILDALNAEHELLNSQVELVRARRNAYVVGFQLLNATGQSEARDLNLEAGPLYDSIVSARDRPRRIVRQTSRDSLRCSRVP